MRLLWFLLIGLCAGWLAGRFTQGKGFGLGGNLVIGVVGAMIGGFLLWVLGFAAIGLFAQLITATVGAVILLAALSAARRPRRR